MKKLTSHYLTILITLCALAFSGCNGNSGDSTPAPDAANVDQTEPPVEPPTDEPEQTRRPSSVTAPYANYGTVMNILPPGQKANGGLAALGDMLPLDQVPGLGDPLGLVLAPTLDGLQQLVNAIGDQAGLVPALQRDDNLTDQLDMYAAIAKAPKGLTNADLGQYFKPAPLLAADSDDWKSVTEVDDTVHQATIKRDNFGVPHIYGATHADGIFGFGYVTAADRLFILDVLRRAGRGELSKFLGPADFSFDFQIATEAPYREADRTAQIEDVRTNFGADGEQMADDLQSFVDGLNLYQEKVRKGLLNAPIEYVALGVPLEPFVPEDVVAIATLIQGIFAGGGGGEVKNVLLLQALEQKLGDKQAACDLWRDMRAANDPDAPVNITDSFATQSPAVIDESFCPLDQQALANDYPGAVMFDAGSYQPYQPLVVEPCGAQQASACPGSPENNLPSLPLFNILDGLQSDPAATLGDLLGGLASISAPLVEKPTAQVPTVNDINQTDQSAEDSLWQRLDGKSLVASLDHAKAPMKTPRMQVQDQVSHMLESLHQLRGAFPNQMSNALLLTADQSASGHPLAVFGPQTGYFEPQLLIEVAISAGDIQSRGMAFAGLPYVLIGHGPDFAWSATSGNTDLTDAKVLDLCGSGTFHGFSGYIANGSCHDFDLIDEDWGARWNLGATDDPLQNYAVQRRVIRTDDYGPVIGYATVNSKPVVITSQRSTYHHELDTALPFMQVSQNDVYDVQSFYDIFANVTGSFNWFYIDDTDIAFYEAGKYPLRADGVNAELPSWGGKNYDWQGFVAADDHPHAANPERGFLQSWNNKQAPGWWAADANATYGPVQRVQALQVRLEKLVENGNNSLANLVEAMADAAFVDLRGQEVLPYALDLLEQGDLGASQQQVVDLLRQWVADGAFRRDRDGDGQYDDHAAVALMNTWYPLMVDATLPQVTMMEDIEGQNLNLLDTRDQVPSAQGSAYQTGYYGYLQRVFKQALGTAKHPYKSMQCADSEEQNACRDALLSSFNTAIDALGGVAAMDSWDVDMSQEFVEHRAIGLTNVPAIPWQNRPTFQQAVEFTGHR